MTFWPRATATLLESNQRCFEEEMTAFGKLHASFKFRISFVYIKLQNREEKLFVSHTLQIYYKLINFKFILYPFSECAPSTTFYINLDELQVYYKSGFLRSGFVCSVYGNVTSPRPRPLKCSVCSVGFHSSDSQDDFGFCEACPPGNFVVIHHTSEVVLAPTYLIVPNGFFFFF